METILKFSSRYAEHKSNFHDPRYSFENFVAEEANYKAKQTAYEFAISTTSLKKSLIITGASGTGKTHLAIAISKMLKEMNEEAKLFTVSAQFLSYDYKEHIKNGGNMNSFCSCLSECNLMIIDSYEPLTVFPADLVERLKNMSAKLIFTTSFFNKEQVKADQEIILSGNLTPSEKRKIIEDELKTSEVNLDTDLLDKLSQTSLDNAREVQGLVITLLASSQVEGTKITLPFIKQHANKFRTR